MILINYKSQIIERKKFKISKFIKIYFKTTLIYFFIYFVKKNISIRFLKLLIVFQRKIVYKEKIFTKLLKK